MQRKCITLLDPVSWDDKNDTEIMLEYKKRKKLKGLLALCFSYGDETIHHWKAFSNGSSGCLIEFDAIAIIKAIDGIPSIKHGKVQYEKLREIEKKDRVIELEEIPFIKRWPYRCEAEYRVIKTSDKSEKYFDISIPLESINRITISQHMPEQIYKTIKNYLRELRGDPESRINRSTLYENKRWINRFRQY
ncbi:MAG: hypothetical protein IPL74_15130 [Bacteroidetes bacterium]|nr:hypothetical protein [Bacteroidota bacterium]